MDGISPAGDHELFAAKLLEDLPGGTLTATALQVAQTHALLAISLRLAGLTEEVRAASVAVLDGPDRRAIDLADLRGDLNELKYDLERDLAAEASERQDEQKNIRDEQAELLQDIRAIGQLLNGQAT